MQDMLRQRLQQGDKIRVNRKAKKTYLHGKVGKVVGYVNVVVLVDGKRHNIVPTSLDVIEEQE